VTLTLTRWRGARGRAVMLALVTALIPLPALASESTPASKGPKASTATTAATSQVSLKERAAREASRIALTPDTRARRAARAEQDTAGKDSPAFFKSKPGFLALAVMVAGAGYALYSAKNDRITSPAKQ
jgi:hypothetical protein